MANFQAGHSLSNWLNSIKDDIDGGLAADFDGSLSGLGVELGTSTYNMSEALLALPVFKQESLSGTHSAGTSEEQMVVLNPGPFQYILAAPTSPATKMNEETLTYLNQGQSYEIKLKHLLPSSPAASPNEARKECLLRSVVRVVFHERRLQFMEREQLNTWRDTRPGERIVDIDIPLSYGLLDVKMENSRLNALEVVWDSSKEAAIFVKVHCISTEFTAKRHGGEKGVSFRIQVETYNHDDHNPRLLHCASCQVKVFKPKGADRKIKTDREKLEKRPPSDKEKYQPSYECTVLTEIPLDQVIRYLEQLRQQELEESSKSQINTKSGKGKNVRNFQCLSESSSSTNSGPENHTTSGSNCDVSEKTMDGETTYKKGKNNSAKKARKSVKSLDVSTMEVTIDTLSVEATDTEVADWLKANRFSAFVKVFEQFTGADLLKLSRDDLIQICGLADGIRLNNALQHKQVRPKLTIFVCQHSKKERQDSASSVLDISHIHISNNSPPHNHHSTAGTTPFELPSSHDGGGDATLPFSSPSSSIAHHHGGGDFTPAELLDAYSIAASSATYSPSHLSHATSGYSPEVSAIYSSPLAVSATSLNNITTSLSQMLNSMTSVSLPASHHSPTLHQHLTSSPVRSSASQQLLINQLASSSVASPNHQQALKQSSSASQQHLSQHQGLIVLSNPHSASSTVAIMAPSSEPGNVTYTVTANSTNQHARHQKIQQQQQQQQQQQHRTSPSKSPHQKSPHHQKQQQEQYSVASILTSSASGLPASFTIPQGVSPPSGDRPESGSMEQRSPSQSHSPSPVDNLAKEGGGGPSPIHTVLSASSRLSSMSLSSTKRQLAQDDDSDQADNDCRMYAKKARTRHLELKRKDVYHALYLEHLSVPALREAVAGLFLLAPHQLTELFIQTRSAGVLVLVTDPVVCNLPDQARYSIDVTQDETKDNIEYVVVLKEIL